ncbi:MurR/RpiR family transcriptional regulator [Oceanobacillus saliphilus]|uniref:MurR/RpiR family transcriptional regulator n=1 Tax=Oceanobacillus saliphilus TaxID=2925834 RepID=UPI00201D4470|nr:MurR/RpiR family transcriptional regulator [Oceanobacillus saliphilus]
MLETLINNQYGILSTGQKQIAEKLLNHPESYTMLTITEFSKKLGVSEASLTRFARALDFKGYHDFQGFLKEQLITQLSPKLKMKNSLEKRATIKNRLQSELQKDMESLVLALQTINTDHFEQAVELLANANRIYIVGLGVSKSLVSFLEFRLRRIGMERKALTTGGHELLERLLSIQPSDVLIAIGFQRNYEEIVTALDYVKEKQIPSIAIVENPLSPIARKADVPITIKRGPRDQLNSLAVPISVCNALMLELTLLKEEEAMNNMENLEFLTNQYKINLKENEK